MYSSTPWTKDVQFTLTCSTEEIQFLDTKVYKQGNMLASDLYVKPTDN